MSDQSTSKYYDELHRITLQIKHEFSPNSGENDNSKWLLLKEFKTTYLHYIDSNQIFVSSYYSVLSSLLECLRPNIFCDKNVENLYDDIFLEGLHHESFMILVRRLGEVGPSFEQQKIIDLLQKFIQQSKIESLCTYQCEFCGPRDLKYTSLSKIWGDLITLIVSLPDRMANKTKGQMNKIFSTSFYIPMVVSSVFKTLSVVHKRMSVSQDMSCSLEFLGKLIGRLCDVGYADIVTKKFSVEFVEVTENDFIWRRIIQNLFTKIPMSSSESFITHLLLAIPWYGYIEWVFGDVGMKNKKINYIMSVKLLLFRHFKKALILQNIIGYFASSDSRISEFWKIFKALLTTWSDSSALKHQSFEQQMYIASALMVCAGWIKQVKAESNNKAYIERVLHGVQIRIGSSEESVRNLGMITGESLIIALDPNAQKLEFEFTDMEQVNYLRSLMEIPLQPETNYCSFLDDLKCFEEIELEQNKWKLAETVDRERASEVKGESSSQMTATELDSDDDLEPYDMSNDVPAEETKKPLYLRDCLLGLIEQQKSDYTEQCLKHAESLIRTNSDIVHEIAVEMAKVLLHLDDKFAIDDFVALRHRALISLAVTCPILVANYLTSQFYERDYNIRQRLDILEVLAAASQELSRPDVTAKECKPSYSRENFAAKSEHHWKSIIDQRLKAKTRYITKAPNRPQPVPQENKFSSVAGYFFFPLMEKYDTQNAGLKLLDKDSYVLGRLIYALGIIMYSAENIPISKVMGSSLLAFLTNVRNHEDGFVRQAVVFAMAATYISVPGYLLSSDMLSEVLESQEWLLSIIENDADVHCQMKASHALGIITAVLKEEMPLLSGVLKM